MRPLSSFKQVDREVKDLPRADRRPQRHPFRATGVI